MADNTVENRTSKALDETNKYRQNFANEILGLIKAEIITGETTAIEIIKILNTKLEQ